MIIILTIGTILEWFDFILYGYLAGYLGHIFLPSSMDSNTAMLISYGFFFTTYLVRPIGSYITGIVSDVYGRINSLSLCLICMGLSGLGISILPTYDKIGVLAPILLIQIRIIQGFSISGEFTGAAIYLFELYKHHKYHNFYISIISISSAFGMVIGSFVTTIVSKYSIEENVWRIPFAIGGLSAVVGGYLRYKSITYKKHTDNLKFTFTQYKKQLILSFLIAAWVSSYIYICNMWWSQYMIQKQFLNAYEAYLITTINLCLSILLTIIFALIADIKSTTFIFKLGILLSTVATFIIFYLSSTGSMALAFIAQIFFIIPKSLVTSSMFKILSELFPYKIRARAIGVTWSCAVAAIGGTAPLVAQYLAFNLQQVVLIPIYINIISIAVLIIMRHK